MVEGRLKSAVTVWCQLINIDQNLWGRFPTLWLCKNEVVLKAKGVQPRYRNMYLSVQWVCLNTFLACAFSNVQGGPLICIHRATNRTLTSPWCIHINGRPCICKKENLYLKKKLKEAQTTWLKTEWNTSSLVLHSYLLKQSRALSQFVKNNKIFAIAH